MINFHCWLIINTFIFKFFDEKYYVPCFIFNIKDKNINLIQRCLIFIFFFYSKLYYNRLLPGLNDKIIEHHVMMVILFWFSSPFKLIVVLLNAVIDSFVSDGIIKINWIFEQCYIDDWPDKTQFLQTNIIIYNILT